MKNLDYLETFFKKHNLSGKVTVKFTSPIALDEYMSDIIFENGDKVSINDVIFDVESELPDYIFHKWMDEKKQTDITLIDWMKTSTISLPKDIDISSVTQYQNELTELFKDVKENINALFQEDIDDVGDSDYDGSESEDE